MTPIACRPLDYATASEGLQRTHVEVGEVPKRLLDSLSSCAGMAGWDAAGQEFAATYDDAVGALFVTLSNGTFAAAQLADLLHATGFNHANADDPNAPPGVEPSDYPPSPNLSSGSPSAVETPPSANGGDDDPPWGWSLVEGAIGYIWPNGDEAKLQTAADAWSLAAAGLRTATFPVADAIDRVAAQQSPEVEGAVAACEEYKSHLHELADCCMELSKACDDYAGHLADAHQQILDLVDELLWELALLGTISVVGSFFTVGGAAVGGSAAATARVATYAARISLVITKLVSATGVIGRSAAAAAGRITQLSSRIWASVSSRAKVLASKIPGVDKLSRVPLRQQLDEAQTVRGKFDNINGPPNGFLVRRDQQGNVTHYIQYDELGKGIKRVDLTGASHAGIPTPHVVHIVHDRNPITGQTFARELTREVRPATPDEIP